MVVASLKSVAIPTSAMNKPSLPPDDLPPSAWTEQDNFLHRKLEEAVSRYFYESCDGVTQALLTNCEWYFTITASALTLVINCSDRAINLRVINNVTAMRSSSPGGAIAARLKAFSKSARIHIYPPDAAGIPLEVRVDETSVYQDPF